jgi:uncharacterized RDD family membrane protein YckC
MNAITVLKQNVPQGPFSRAEVAERLNRGEFTLDSLAFVEGLSAWTPLRQVLARIDAAPPPSPVQYASPPSQQVAHVPAGSAFAYARAPELIAPAYSYAATMAPPGHLAYAGFWLRFVAYLVDSFVLGAALFGVAFLVGLAIALTGGGGNSLDQVSPVAAALYGFLYLLMVVMCWLYFALQESSRAQATIGKRVLGIYVTDRQGQRIGFGRATGRFFGKIISGMIFYVGFMMAGWTERKQALHDMIADTLVARKPGS